MFSRVLAAAVVSLVSCGTASGQPHLDLATTGSLSQTVEAGTYTVTLENRLPQARYGIVVLREHIPVQAISLDGVGSLAALQRLIPELSVSPCDQLVAAAQNLNDATAESQVPARTAAVVALLDEK